MARKQRSRPPSVPPAGDSPTAPEFAAAPAAQRILILGPALTIANAESLRTELLALVEGGGDVGIDGSAVEAVDTAGMQVLVAFRRALRDGSRKLTWSGCSPVLMDVSGLLGLQEQIGVTA